MWSYAQGLPGLGHGFMIWMVGTTLMGTYGFDSPSFISDLEPLEAYDFILQNVAHCSPRTSRPLLTPWTRRPFTYESNSLQM